MDQLLTVVGIKSKSNLYQKNENLLAFAWKNCLLFTFNLKKSFLWSCTKQIQEKKRFNWIPVGLSLLVGCQCMSDKTNLNKQTTSASDKKMLLISLGHLVTEGTQVRCPRVTDAHAGIGYRCIHGESTDPNDAWIFGHWGNPRPMPRQWEGWYQLTMHPWVVNRCQQC